MSLQQVTEITQGALSISASGALEALGVSIDTRTLKRGELYVAIRGVNHDGHSFLAEAQDRGAVGALIEPGGVKRLPESLPAVIVADSHQALIELAIAHRKQLIGKTVGITGSVGKTTVKEMTRHLLQSVGVTAHASAGNLNNLYGLPLSLLRMDRSIQYGVFELGVSTAGEMKRLAPILRPQVGVITNISETHIETLGSLEGVRREKLTLLENLSASGVAVVNGADSELVKSAGVTCDKVLTFGVAPAGRQRSQTDVTASDVRLDPATGFVSFQFEGSRIQLPVFGEEQVGNALCALTITRALGVEVELRSIETFSAEVMALRGERKCIAGVDVIVDCYNANPTSMRAGLKTFASLRPTVSGGRKIAVIGDMLELGAIESQEHIALGKYLSDIVKTAGEIDVIITVGQRARLIAGKLHDLLDGACNEANDAANDKSVTIHSVSDAREAGELLQEIVAGGDTLYLKASRGIALENALAALSTSSVSKARSQE